MGSVSSKIFIMSNISTENREKIKSGYQYWINIARAIGIILVVLGHTWKNPIQEFGINMIYSVHMPFFFVLSGMLYKSHSLRYILTVKAKRLLVPYLLFYILFLIYFLTIERRFRPDSDVGIKWQLLSMVYGSNIKGGMNFNVVLWFLPALWSTEVLYCLIKKAFGKFSFIGFILTSFIGILLYRYSSIILPMGLNIAFIAVLFYYFGDMLKPAFTKKVSVRYVLLIGIIVILILFFSNGTERLDMASGKYPSNLLKTITIALSGSLGILLTASIIARFRPLELLGISEITLCIMCIHGAITRVLKTLSPIDTDSYFIGLVICVLTLVISYFLARLYCRFTKSLMWPWLDRLLNIIHLGSNR